LKTTLIVTGKTEDSYLKSGIGLYEGRLKHYLDFRILEIPSVKNADISQLKKKEGEILLKNISGSDTLVLLDEAGKQYSSVDFSQFMQQTFNKSTKHLVFAVGGAFGFSDEIYKRANAKMSLSLMTFPHQMIRLLFVEQLYRAMTILKNESYHHR